MESIIDKLKAKRLNVTEFPMKKHTTLVVNLVIGETVTVNEWGIGLQGKQLRIDDIQLNLGGCESGVQVKLDGYDGYIDSGWITKL